VTLSPRPGSALGNIREILFYGGLLGMLFQAAVTIFGLMTGPHTAVTNMQIAALDRSMRDLTGEVRALAHPPETAAMSARIDRLEDRMLKVEGDNRGLITRFNDRTFGK